MKKIGVFADVQNIYYTCRQHFQRQFNYRQCWQHIAAQGEIEHAYAYAIDRQDSQQLKFQDALRHLGFEIKLKPFISRSDGTSKGDWDVGMTVDMMHYAPELDHIVLLCGDGDFAPLLAYLKAHFSVTIEIISVESLTAKALIDQAHHCTFIDKSFLL